MRPWWLLDRTKPASVTLMLAIIPSCVSEETRLGLFAEGAAT